MAIEIANQTVHRLRRPPIERAVELVLRFAKRKGNVSVAIVSDAVMKKYNYAFRKKNTPTDILSFAEQDSETPSPDFVGELIIDFDQIKRQAKTFGHSLQWELAFIVIHGTLHLVGYEDETEEGRKEMEKIGYRLIKKMSL
jgi:probable rRNA maturation factor